MGEKCKGVSEVINCFLRYLFFNELFLFYFSARATLFSYERQKAEAKKNLADLKGKLARAETLKKDMLE
jgi:hypothetical protein